MKTRTLLLMFCACMSSAALAVERHDLEPLIDSKTIPVAKIRAYGPEVMPVLAEIYAATEEDDNRRARIAWIFYQLSWLSPEAEAVLMEDIRTPDAELRLQVQWALGRVSRDDRVVNVLLDNMRNDDVALFRDKAACALASDQIHLAPEQRFDLLEGLVEALSDKKQQVRDIAIKALQIQTGQTKGFSPGAATDRRTTSIDEWQEWLQEYRENL